MAGILLSSAFGSLGVNDGDKGDITVSASGSTWSLNLGVVGTTKLGGDITAAGKALLDDADAAAQRTTLGLGTAATVNTGTSGATIPLLDANNTFSGISTFSGNIVYNGITQASIQSGSVTGQLARWNNTTNRYEAFDLLSATNTWSGATNTFSNDVAVNGALTVGGTAVALVGHTHTASNITDFNSVVRAQVEAMLVQGTNITIAYGGTGASRTATINSTGGGGSGVTGTATLNFGAAPGKSALRHQVADTRIAANSKVEAWLFGSTTDHNEEEHAFIPLRIGVVNRVAGVGFTLFAASELRLSGTFNVAYRITE